MDFYVFVYYKLRTLDLVTFQLIYAVYPVTHQYPLYCPPGVVKANCPLLERQVLLASDWANPLGLASAGQSEDIFATAAHAHWPLFF